MFFEKLVERNRREPGDLQKIAAQEGGWQKFIKWRHQIRDGDFIPDPAAAPIGTDQEAGGAITTPEGNRKYDGELH